MRIWSVWIALPLIRHVPKDLVKSQRRLPVQFAQVGHDQIIAACDPCPHGGTSRHHPVFGPRVPVVPIQRDEHDFGLGQGGDRHRNQP